MTWSCTEGNRIGDHAWWISDTRRFECHCPGWSLRYDIDGIIAEIYDEMASRVARVS